MLLIPLLVLLAVCFVVTRWQDRREDRYTEPRS